MGRECAVCKHKDRKAVEKAIIEGSSYREIIKQYKISLGSLSRHLAEHVNVSETDTGGQVGTVAEKLAKNRGTNPITIKGNRGTDEPFYPRLRIAGMLVGASTIGFTVWRSKSLGEGLNADWILNQIAAAAAKANESRKIYGYTAEEIRQLDKRHLMRNVR